jgi:Uma2 family endonuclease
MNYEPSTFAPPEQEVTEFEFNSFHRMPSRNHGLLQTRISSLLEVKYGKEFSILTAVDLDLPTGKSVPDISIYPTMAYDWDVDEVKMKTAPLTTIEILSPQQALTDLTDKNNIIYFPAGVQSAWIIIPVLRQVNILLPNKQKSVFNSGTIKDPATGIELEIADIFR